MTFKDDFQKFIKDIRRKAEKTGQVGPMKILGNFARDLIRDRTREGFGVKSQGGYRKKLKPLTQKYIQKRRGMRLSPFTSPSKSNLTLTGSMLDSLVFKASKGNVTIEPSGRDNKGVSNVKKAEWQEEQGRIFLRLSVTEMKQVTEFYQKEILDKQFD